MCLLHNFLRIRKGEPEQSLNVSEVMEPVNLRNIGNDTRRSANKYAKDSFCFVIIIL